MDADPMVDVVRRQGVSSSAHEGHWIRKRTPNGFLAPCNSGFFGLFIAAQAPLSTIGCQRCVKAWHAREKRAQAKAHE